ncbi:AI-2E family transporter [Mucilaginibacter limnophilus]|uniref:AI-2E family transporter n=1 Tax=Mucilaginibacter limnophilus TaxID=1932778 RepID=A0A437ML52_9SPHI|nr:AI-2E family transporter [Mucilaginibacter limnophilus]RVT98390.1 AI-2E family transporter [Mucilaginibacter limnophilus]
MSIFNYKQRNNIVLATIVLLGCFLFYALSGLFSSILGAIVLYSIFRSSYIYLVEKKGWNGPVIAVGIIVLSLIVIVIPFLILSFMVVSKISTFSQNTVEIQRWLQKLDDFAGSNLNQPHFTDDVLTRLSDYATSLFPSIIGGAIHIVLILLFMYFILYFMFVQMRSFEAGLLRYSPFREQHALKFAQELRNSTYSNVLGQGIISVVQGFLLANGFYFAGIPDPVFWGVIAIFISFLPVVGAPTLTIPAGLMLMADGHPVSGVLLLLYGVIFIGNVDNILRMVINKRVANTHPLISLIGVFIGLPLFGILGLVFGPLLLSYFLLLVEIYQTNRMAAERLDRIRTGPDM